MQLHQIHSLINALSQSELGQTEIESIVSPLQIPTVLGRQIYDLLQQNFDANSLYEELQLAASKTTLVSQQDLDLKTYAKLLAYLKIVDHVSGTQSAHIRAYKLTVILGDAEKAIQYLEKVYKETKGSVVDPVETACDFDLPSSDNWSKEHWQIIFQKYLHHPEFRKSGITSRMADLEKRLLASQTVALAYELKNSLYITSINLKIAEHDTVLQTVSKDIAAIRKKMASLKVARPNKEGPDPSPIEAEAPEQMASLKVPRPNEEGSDPSIIEAEAPEQLEKYKIQLGKMSKAIAEEKAKLKKLNRAKIKLLQKQTPLLSSCSEEALLNELVKIKFKNAKRDEVAAYLFNRFGESEEHFEEFLKLKDSAQSSDSLIPNVEIDGNAIGCKGYYLVKLSSTDPKCALLGKITGCCQHLGGEGARCVRYGMTSGEAGFYIVCKGKKPKAKKGQPFDSRLILPSNIVAQSFAWRGQSKNLVFDSIESPLKIRENPKNKQAIIKMFYALAHQLVSEHAIQNVNVGAGGTLHSQGYAPTQPDKPIGMAQYHDSFSQNVLASRKHPLYAKMMISPASAIQEIGQLSQNIQAGYDYKIFAKILAEHGTLKDISLLFNALKGEEKNRFLIQSNLQNIAIQKGRPELIKCLMTLGWDNQSKDEQGNNLLHLAIQANNPKMIQFALELGIDPYQTNDKGQNAFTLASVILNPEDEMLQKLLNQWLMDVKDQKTTIIADQNGQSLLHCLVKQNNLKGIASLARRDFNLNCTNRDGETPLITAIRFANKKTLVSLLKKGANVNQMDAAGRTPLIWATLTNNVDFVKKVLSYQPDYEARDSKNHSAVYYAGLRQFKPIVKVIKRHHAKVKQQEQTLKTAATEIPAPATFQYATRKQAKATIRSSWSEAKLTLRDNRNNESNTQSSPEHGSAQPHKKKGTRP